jgi:hypothetical protein
MGADEYCPSCGGPIIEGGPCPHCTSPLPGYHGPLEPEAPGRVIPSAPTGSVRARVAVMVLPVGLGLYWIVTAVRQYAGARNNGPGGDSLLLFVVAVLSLIVGLYTLYVAWAVFRRSYRVQGQLVLVSLLGTCWGVFVPLLLGGPYQYLVVPFHVALGVLAITQPRYFEPGR